MPSSFLLLSLSDFDRNHCYSNSLEGGGVFCRVCSVLGTFLRLVIPNVTYCYWLGSECPPNSGHSLALHLPQVLATSVGADSLPSY